MNGMSLRRIEVELDTSLGEVRASYEGGPHIEFDSGDVTNVWDYEKGRPGIAFAPEAVIDAILEVLTLEESERARDEDREPETLLAALWSATVTQRWE